jgi:hypothetical protein
MHILIKKQKIHWEDQDENWWEIFNSPLDYVGWYVLNSSVSE